jgi:hypothetical protein
MTCLGTTDPKTKHSVYSSSQSSIIATFLRHGRKGIARKDPPGTPDLAARSTETRQAEEMRIADGEEEEEEPPRARIHPKGKADAALG